MTVACLLRTPVHFEPSSPPGVPCDTPPSHAHLMPRLQKQRRMWTMRSGRQVTGQMPPVSLERPLQGGAGNS